MKRGQFSLRTLIFAVVIFAAASAVVAQLRSPYAVAYIIAFWLSSLFITEYHALKLHMDRLKGVSAFSIGYCVTAWGFWISAFDRRYMGNMLGIFSVANRLRWWFATLCMSLLFAAIVSFFAATNGLRANDDKWYFSVSCKSRVGLIVFAIAAVIAHMFPGQFSASFLGFVTLVVFGVAIRNSVSSVQNLFAKIFACSFWLYFFLHSIFGFRESFLARQLWQSRDPLLFSTDCVISVATAFFVAYLGVKCYRPNRDRTCD